MRGGADSDQAALEPGLGVLVDPRSHRRVEALLATLVPALTLIIVTHNLAQARRVSSNTMFFYDGELIEHGETTQLFENPQHANTERYVSGRIG